MTSTSNVLLNTENYEPLFEMVTKITEKIRQNERILARIANMVDNKLVYPKEDSDGVRLTREESESSDEQENGDYLRSILDSKFSANNMGEVKQFDDVENPVVRQLLSDNYRLLQMKKAKQAKNSELGRINLQYETLLADQIIPKLTKDVSEQNMKSIVRIRETEVERKLEAQLQLWHQYSRYIDFLDRAGQLVQKLVEALDGTLDSGAMDRLVVQLEILDRLRLHLAGQPLRRAR